MSRSFKVISNVETRHTIMHSSPPKQKAKRRKTITFSFSISLPFYSSGNSELCSKIEEEPKLSSFLSSFPKLNCCHKVLNANLTRLQLLAIILLTIPWLMLRRKSKMRGIWGGGHLFVNATTSIAEIH